MKDSSKKKDILRKSLKFLPAVILLIVYVVRLIVDRHEILSALLMTVFVFLAFAVPSANMIKRKLLKKIFSWGILIIVPPFAFMVVEAQYEHRYHDTDMLDNYLSLIYESDKALEHLISYFSNVDKPTVILMFGDHKPQDSIAHPIYAGNSTTNDGSMDARADRYKTPYLIWSNYDLNPDIDAPEEVSLNYLSGIVMDLAGVPLTPFRLWQKELIKEYPTVNAFSYTDASGNRHSAAGIQKIPPFNTLSQIQYNLIFDTKHTVKEFFLPVVP